MRKDRIKDLLQPFADAIVDMAINMPNEDLSMQIILFGLRMNDFLTDKGIYLN